MVWASNRFIRRTPVLFLVTRLLSLSECIIKNRTFVQRGGTFSSHRVDTGVFNPLPGIEDNRRPLHSGFSGARPSICSKGGD
ncbi:hypothetical protein EV361DRAFT_456337 [Lentinula raphanica]|nr:hypothetical protein EV361DRAFT_456337 [Lentinula raphanica]